jgi:cysteine desulfurase
MERIYLDHAATTPVDPEVVKAMMPYWTGTFGNPSSIHWFGRESRKALEEARATIAREIGADDPKSVILTSGGSEADNLAIKGVAEALKKKGNHIITSSVEHHAVMDSCKHLEKEGFEVTYLPVDEFGQVHVEDVEKAITDRTILVTIMHANNEVGTIQPIQTIGRMLKEKGILFHTDAVQTVGNIPVKMNDLNVDLLSMSSHKFYGPKGVGALVIRKGIRLEPQIHGGAQERNRRAGTENIAGIVGMAKALELANAHLNEHMASETRLRDKLIHTVLDRFQHVRLNGHPTERLPGNVNFSFEYIEGESLLLNLDLKGIAASSGSACTSGSLDPSHVLLAMGLCHEIAHGSLRLTLGKDTTEEQIDYTLEVLPEIVDRLRAMSPLYEVVRKECGECTRTK